MATVNNVDNIANARPSKTYTVVVVGGGSAGISVAAQLAQYPQFKGGKNQILVVEPNDYHYYQPLWTFVGAGLKPFEESRKPTKDIIPDRSDWLQDRVKGFFPERNMILTEKGEHIAYDFLVVAPGIQVNWNAIEGLSSALGKDGVCSNYHEEHVKSTAKFVSEFKGGNAIFTQPATPIKCAGAPQKIMYCAEEAFRERGIREKSSVSLYSGMGKIFAVDKYAEVLKKICAERDIKYNLQHNLVAVRPESKEAVFSVPNGEKVSVKYDLLHVSPPMMAPTFLKNSPEGFTNADGWVNVDKVTTRHVKFPNVFSLGDASSMPTSKTAAAAARQSGVTVWNLVAAIDKREGGAEYDGYTSCPLVTGKGKLILAEFDYSLNPQETFFFNQAQELRSMYYLTADAIPAIYWNGMLKGRWTGPGTYRRLLNPFGSN
ncbi:FAD-dependent pyridine nucleotide-disulfide oxidoreductase [Zopfochytrium polystomum]|nr:FAD-dependent pyridine nucleotide-disulfide oxidoreductase [Zopfochytrium polystomum]